MIEAVITNVNHMSNVMFAPYFHNNVRAETRVVCARPIQGKCWVVTHQIEGDLFSGQPDIFIFNSLSVSTSSSESSLLRIKMIPVL